MNTIQHIATALTLTLAAAASQAAGTLGLTPGNSTVNIGSSFAVQVSGNSFTDNVVGGGFNLGFNPAVLSLSSVAINTGVWEFVSSNGSTNNNNGTLSDVFFNSIRATLPTGSFDIATLTFSAKAAGSSLLTLSGSPDFPFANDLADVINVGFGTGSVTAVPEPATWLSLVLGMALLPMLRRRKAA